MTERRNFWPSTPTSRWRNIDLTILDKLLALADEVID
jgi:hypothetical protein